MSEDKKSITITLKKDHIWKGAAVLFAVLFLWSYFGGSIGNGNTVDNIAAPTQLGTTGNVKVQIEDNDAVLGDKNADISIVEFSDFQCPFCARANTGALADFRNSDYFSNGEVNLIYKQFPLNSIHPFAQKAGEASLCAHDQGKFWEYHDLLFDNQAALRIDDLKSYAAQLGLNAGDFNGCLDDGDYAAEVRKETSQATAAGGRGTPYFVIVNNKNGQSTAVSGAVPFSNLEAAIADVR